ncbi:tetratricopeptide repeat protein [Dongia rigui]|uniref:Tetratricopeptide repeat protein n=1 Tax=Dongia rigui TaxID=940149 RepID=A0ABU5DUC9_9PROT|nr:tetratricopeptide repeat protein [Dongia rigui]MDY0870544.1 tetratricopeptide repeat protein [Dongia rigui]
MLDVIDFTGRGIAPELKAQAKLPTTGPLVAAQKTKLNPGDQRKLDQLMDQAGQAHRQGKIERVRLLLEQVIEIQSDNDLALFNLGIVLRDANVNGRAELMFRRAIKANPERVECYLALGDMLFSLKHALSAVKAYEQGLERAPNNLTMLVNLMRARIALRNPRDVEALARRILLIEPKEADVLCYLAWSLWLQKKDLTEALTYIDRALEVTPDHVRSLAVKERICAEMGDEETRREVEAWLLERMRRGTIADFRCVRDMYHWSDAADKSVLYLNEYLAHHESDPEAEAATIQATMQDGDFVEAHRIVEKLAAQFPDKMQLQMSRALNLFRLGRFDEAMPLMESRWGREHNGGKLDFPVPAWNGEEIRDGKLVIYAEQGVGDHVMYAGHMIPVRERASHIVFEISPRQTTLFQRSFPDFEIIERTNLPPHWRMEEVKAKVAAGDLAYVLGEDYRNLPGREGFLIPHPDLLRKLRKKYQEKFPGKLLVGISWRSGNRDSAGVRSLELENWLPILQNPNCGFVSLQYGDVSRDIEVLKSEFGVEVLHDPTVDAMGNMDPFTCQVAAMDIIISVDNSTIHYAAGLGKPVWAMLPINCDWRWLTEGDKSIWYDSLLLLRQHKGDTWEEMTAKVGGMLANVDVGELHRAHVGMLKRCAETLQKFGRTSDTEDYCRMLLEEDACKDVALHGIAIAAMNVGKPGDAVGILMRALELAPERAELHAELAVALAATGETGAAERIARETLRRFGDSEEALTAMGQILVREERYDEAGDFFARILRKDAGHIPSRVRLAKMMGAQGEWGLARANYDKALKFAPTSAVAHVGVAEASLRQGDWAAGWLEFGWRFGTRPGLLPRHLETIDPKKYPAAWDGNHLKRKRLFLRAERSKAEQLLFAPLLAEAVTEARYVLAECDRELIPLLQPVFPKVEFVPAGTLDPKDFLDKRIQIQTSLGDLAARYRANAAQFNQAPAFALKPDEALTRQLAGEYREVMPNRRLIGLSWRGGDWSMKSRLVDWLELMDADGIAVVAIQRDMPQADLDELAATGRNMIVDPRGQASIEAMAAQIAALDGVIAIDDMTAHLAAQLGKRVVKPVSRVDHWYWGGPNFQQPWYKNVTTVFHGDGSGQNDVINRAIGAAIAQA